MASITISDFCKDIETNIDRVSKEFETLIIRRDKDSDMVLMPLAEYNELMSTYRELSSRANEKRLDSAIEKLQKGEAFEKELLID
ncbi:MAG: type II toxin-antitoxin system Phd/YefM family antitoxin [Sphingobacteriaceae bacterium]|nr:type II toxin-antitoxin system Phd/YefM family antitoxin [Sphingobacteriaceae bacterium]